MPRRLAQQRMTLSDVEWPFHAISAVHELFVYVSIRSPLVPISCNQLFIACKSTYTVALGDAVD